ncbi:MAG TPA: FMN-binding protein [Trebonia sp.]|nr:FMN-binding protein [Trebonia sp.]
MRRIILAVCATAAALVLLLSFKSHTQTATAGSSPAAALGTPVPGTGTATSGSATSGTGPATPAASAAAGSTRGGSAANGTSATVTGAAWPTIYGPVQVRITVSGGKITAATATEYPTDTPRDAQINAFAIPQLNSETVAAGSAQIDTVSGATYTSQGYIGSLQNALDKAKGA